MYVTLYQAAFPQQKSTMALMMFLRRILSVWVLVSFLGTSLTLPPAYAQSAPIGSAGLLFRLPKPGSRVNLSPAFKPVLIKGLKIHPENPFLFDFIVDSGDEKLSAEDFQKTSQRLVNYFLASLAVPEKDLWVNLSPVEKGHIIPDTLIKTELGRDLLAEDYMLKQVGASLIYPDSSFGKTFWAKVYDEAYRKFGVTQIPVNAFNKIWILPEKASVFERGNTVYIVHAHLKVMLEEDYLAQSLLGNKINKERGGVDVKDTSKQVLREVVVPALEKEVNEDKNFAQVRQAFYALILAQWYQDVFKQSVLNKAYAGRNKVVGIDVSDPKNKDLIYRRYLSAYKKGVFNYIKEETDRVTQQPVPRKYFSGGFVGRKVIREPASLDDMAMGADSMKRTVDVSVDLAMSAEGESLQSWFHTERPLSLKAELESLINKEDGKFDIPKLQVLINTYSQLIDSQKNNPVQGAWPILKAIRLLSAQNEQALVEALKEMYQGKEKSRPELVDKIFLLDRVLEIIKNWLKDRTPHLEGKMIYLLAAEIQYWTGGLGPVMEFLGFGMKELGAHLKYIGVRYQEDTNGNILNYESDPNIGFTSMKKDVDGYTVEIGEMYADRRGIVAKGKMTPEDWQALLSHGYIDEKGQVQAKSDGLKNQNYLAMDLPGSSDDQRIKLYNIIQHVRGWSLAESKFSKVAWVMEALITKGILERVPSTKEVRLKVDFRENEARIKEGLSLEVSEQIGRIMQQFGRPLRQIDVKIDEGIDRHGLTTYLQRDVQADGSSYYTKMLYNYEGRGSTESSIFNEFGPLLMELIHADVMERIPLTSMVRIKGNLDQNKRSQVERLAGADNFNKVWGILQDIESRNNPITKEESLAFINVSSAELLRRLETTRKTEIEARGEPWSAEVNGAVVHGNDGQYGPLQAVTMSRYGAEDVIKGVLWAFTTHTYLNRGDKDDVSWAVNTFLKHMMGISDRYINAFRRGDKIDYTSGGVNLADVVGTVSFRHLLDVGPWDINAVKKMLALTNGTEQEEMAKIFRMAFNKLKEEGRIPQTADYNRPTPRKRPLSKENAL